MRIDSLKKVARHPVTAYRIRRAKTLFRRTSPCCWVCGLKPSFFGRNNDVHHLIPVHIGYLMGEPELATSSSNLVTCCRAHHFLLAHLGNWKTYNASFYPTAAAVRKAVRLTATMKSKEDL